MTELAGFSEPGSMPRTSVRIDQEPRTSGLAAYRVSGGLSSSGAKLEPALFTFPLVARNRARQRAPDFDTMAISTVAQDKQITWYREVMRIVSCFFLLCLLPSLLSSGQTPYDETVPQPPSLPVIDYNACPFEGCMFRKWIVLHDSDTFSSWKEGRKFLSKAKKGDVVTGLTGVHITYEPDRIEVLLPIPELGVQPGEIIFRYMYHGEGFADIWLHGNWKKEYDCSFITEQDGSGCSRGCAAKVVSYGKKDWWSNLRPQQAQLVGQRPKTNSIAWTRLEGTQSARP